MQVDDVGLIQGIAHDALFELLDFGMDGFADRLITLGNEVEQGIQHKVFTMLQQQRPCFATLAYGFVRG